MSEKVMNCFLNLLCCFMNHQELAEEIMLSEEEWRQLLRMASEHHVTAMIYDVLGRTAVFAQQPNELKQKIKRAAMQDIMAQTQRTQLFRRYYQGLQRAGVKPLVIKGIVCRSLYPKPDCRPSGDEDMLIDSRDFKATDAYLISEGFIRDKDYKTDVIPEEMGYRNMDNGAYYEIHTSLFDQSSDAYGHFNQVFADVIEKRISINIDGLEVYTMDVSSHFCYLCCHSMKHFLHGGVGIRQLCDIVMFASGYGHQIEWEDFWNRASALKMGCYCANLLDIGERYFNFSYEKAGAIRSDFTVDSEDLLLDIIDSGIYGKTSTGRMHSANITLQAAGQGSGNRTIAGIWKSLFPSSKYMYNRYAYAAEHHILLPAAYIQRILNYRKEKKSSGDGKSGMQVGMQRVELLKKYGIIK